MCFGQCIMNPRRITYVRQQGATELQPLLEDSAVFERIAEEEVPRRGNWQPARTEEPLVHLHLTLVTPLPGIIERKLFLRARCLVIDDDEFALWVHPKIVNRPEYEKTRPVQDLNPLPVLPPIFELWVGKGNGINTKALHQGMCFLLGPVVIEFALEQRIYSDIERECRSIGAANAPAAIEGEAAGTLKEKIEFTPAQAVWFL
jgi:hypothetical protein